MRAGSYLVSYGGDPQRFAAALLKRRMARARRLLCVRDPQRFAAALLKHAVARVERTQCEGDPQRFAAALLKPGHLGCPAVGQPR